MALEAQGVLDTEKARTVASELGESRLRALLRWMKLQRALEDRIVSLYKQGEVVGGVYTGHGQEAIGVGSAVQLREGDVIFPSHRDLGAFLVRGMQPGDVFAQYLGRVDGPTRGRDGNMHMGDWDLGIGAFVSHMADTVPVAAGAALSLRQRGLDNVVLCYNGDGASSRGDWHEGLNLAAVLNLPVVYICVNNQWAYSTPLDRQMAVERVAERASGYGMPTDSVDGNDVLAVHRSVGEAIDRARSGAGPSFVECVTYRMTGHSHHDPAHYVPDHFFEEGKRRDPIDRYQRWLQERGVLEEEELREVSGEIEEAVEAGLEEGRESAWPEGPEAVEGVYATEADGPRPPSAARSGGDNDSRSETPAAVGKRGERESASELAQRVDDVPLHFDTSVEGGLLPEQEDGNGTAGAEDGELATYLEAIREALQEEMRRDDRTFLIGEDIGNFGGAFRVTEGMIEEFGQKRVIDTPISEAGFTGAAVGAAMMGMRPIVEYQFSSFMSCAFDQITNFAAKTYYRIGVPVPVTFRAPAGGGVHGGPFHSECPEMYFVNTPGLKVVVPATAPDAKSLLKAAIRDPNPVLVLEQKYLYRRAKGVLPAPEDRPARLGTAAVRREGRKLTLLTYGAMLPPSLEAAARVAEESGEDAVEVIDLRSLVPLDRESILRSVRKTNRVLVVHEDNRTGGFAGEIAALVSDEALIWLDAPVRRVTAPDAPVPFSPPLEDFYRPSAEKIADAALELLRF